MPQAEQQARKRYTVRNPVEDVRSQVNVSKELPEFPIVLKTLTDLNNKSTLHLYYVKFGNSDSDEDEVIARSERGEIVSLFIPHNPNEPATVFIPN